MVIAFCIVFAILILMVIAEIRHDGGFDLKDIVLLILLAILGVSVYAT